MGIFSKSKKKGVSSEEARNNSGNNNPRSLKKSRKKVTSMPPSMELVPDYVEILRTAQDTSGEDAAAALKALFNLSEHSSDPSNREDLVHETDQVVPTLLEFLNRAERNSSEQYLALLVLNNISIPAENKKVIAIDAGGVHVLSRILCEDPSCHLVAIILVNLTFADSDLRRDLVNPSSSLQLVDALTYAILVATTPADGTDIPAPPEDQFSPRDLLGAVVSQMSSSPADVYSSDKQILFPETARWCLCALKNLTRPSSKDSATAQTLMDTGIVIPLLLKMMNSPGESSDAVWEPNSLQDAALFTILNLSATPISRRYLKEMDAVHTLSLIADYGTGNKSVSSQFQLQCIKARLALAYLVGSEGHYGQKKKSRSFTDDESVLLIGQGEAELLEELLVNTLHQRGKDGEGGYSAATFPLKGVLLGIRCLLTNNMNQNTFMMTCGVRLNVLLLKALAQHSVLRVLTMDADAAECAVWSLYLLSNYGFKSSFLPDSFSGEAGLAEKVLTAYLHMEDITPAGRHAADQILLRLPFLKFSPEISQGDDFEFSGEYIKATQNIMVEKRIHGTEPMDDIFHRPILRSRAPKKDESLQWDNKSVTVFPNALMAVQDLSFGSTKVRHMDAIDDILVANNIASSANGEKTESYNFLWSWQDRAQEMNRKLAHKRGGLKGFLTKVKSNTSSRIGGDDEPFSIFGLKCGVPGCSNGNTKGAVLDDETLTSRGSIR